MHIRIRRIRNRRRWWRLHNLQRFRRDESGVQLVEAAIVLPIFLVLFAATAEFGRYFYEYTTLATTPGTFIVPPLKAEEMSSPETFGRSATDKVIIETAPNQN